MLICPDCGSMEVAKNGLTHYGKQNHRCKACKRQFVQESRRISQETWDLVEKLLLEKIPLAGISRVTGISERWLQVYVNRKYEAVPKEVSIKKRQGA